jgi:hypothetical protein
VVVEVLGGGGPVGGVDPGFEVAAQLGGGDLLEDGGTDGVDSAGTGGGEDGEKLLELWAVGVGLDQVMEAGLGAVGEEVGRGGEVVECLGPCGERGPGEQSLFGAVVDGG